MKKTLIVDAKLVNEGKIISSDLLIEGERISKIAPFISDAHAKVIDFGGNYLLPGMIDDQVHFRDPGLTYKGDLFSESKAAIAGGVTSFMDMPNTIPNTLNRVLLEDKYALAAQKSLANYSFFMGITSKNLDEALRVNNETVCGITDDGLYFDQEQILANHPEFLEKLFSRSNTLVALHSEDDSIIFANHAQYFKKFNGEIPMSFHAKIRSEEACLEATQRVLSIQKKYGNRLHFFHISTGAEANLFPASTHIMDKRVTAEACIHHLWFNDSDYENLGPLIKWNPSIKSEENRIQLIQALKDGRLDIIASDHAPHSSEEKVGTYDQIKSGAPIVQHTMPLLFQLVQKGEIDLKFIADKTSHRVADIYKIKNRGYLREGFFADLIEVDFNSNNHWCVTKDSLHYKSGWSPLIGEKLNAKIKRTFVNGNLIFEKDIFVSDTKGQRLLFSKLR